MEAFRSLCLSLFAPTVIDVPGQMIDTYMETVVPTFAGMGLFIARIDNVEVRSVETLFQAVAGSCNFPRSFGHNWDALKDSLLDFSWMQPRPSGFLLLFRHPELLNWSDLSEFIIVTDRVRMIYAQHRKPFKVLMACHEALPV